MSAALCLGKRRGRQRSRVPAGGERLASSPGSSAVEALPVGQQLAAEGGGDQRARVSRADR